MAEERVVQVLKAPNGRSYFKPGWGVWYVNGNPAERTPGSSEWYFVEGDVTSIEERRGGASRRSHYELKPDVAAVARVAGLPERKELDAFTVDDDDGGLVGEHAQFYQAVMVRDPDVALPVAFTVFQAVAEPQPLPRWARSEFPHNLDFPDYFQHAFPCRIEPKELWAPARAAVLKAVEAAPGCYKVADYDNIQTMTVSLRLTVPFVHLVRRQTNVLTAKRPKYVHEQQTERLVPILTLVGTYKQEGDSETLVRLPTLRGRNLAELRAKIDEYCADLAAMVTPDARQVCPLCEGSGNTARGVRHQNPEREVRALNDIWRAVFGAEPCWNEPGDVVTGVRSLVDRLRALEGAKAGTEGQGAR